jgi:hypothetical protein
MAQYSIVTQLTFSAKIIIIPSFVEMPFIKAMTRGPASLQNRSIRRIWELRAVQMNFSETKEESPHFPRGRVTVTHTLKCRFIIPSNDDHLFEHCSALSKPGDILRLTQSRSIDTVFMIKHNFSTHAKIASAPSSDDVVAGAIDFWVDRYQNMVHDDATAMRCPTVFRRRHQHRR